MRVKPTFLTIAFLLLMTPAYGQVDDICREFGINPSLDSPFAAVPYIFGRVTVKGGDANAKPPRITVVLVDPQQTQKRLTVEKSGNYCFRRSTNSSGTLVVDVDGNEVARRAFGSFGPAQQREDFEVTMSGQPPTAPGTVSAKFAHPPNEKTAQLYKKAVEAEKAADIKRTIEHLKEIVAIDAADFVAWAKLGSLQMGQKQYADAESSFRRSLALKPEYTPAWINAGKIRMVQKQYEAAIEVFKHTISVDPTLARAHQLLGECYLLTKQGSLGVEALNNALQLDPSGMAECHLQLAHLYQLAGAKQMAAKEYKMFLEKRPTHPDKQKFEKFIKENP